MTSRASQMGCIMVNGKRSVLAALFLALGACSTTSTLPPGPTYRPPAYPVPVESAPEVTRSEVIYPDQPEVEVMEQGPAEEVIDTLVIERQTPPDPEPFDDSPLYSAEVQLLEDAQRYADAGNLQLASSSVERVLRINPRSAPALFQLAKLRLAQSAPREAEQLLLKAISGSAYDRRSQDQTFQRQLWALVVEARKALNDQPGAEAAQARVDALR